MLKECTAQHLRTVARHGPRPRRDSAIARYGPERDYEVKTTVRARSTRVTIILVAVLNL